MISEDVTYPSLPNPREATMELMRILETPGVVRVVLALSLAMMMAIVIGLI
ncbi:hypothetical protein SAMN05880592_102166 [Bosea sp. TND4EK4]|nr:hypothetical protein SAMN05880592_102166 [Bosea sp. TND4EK4]